MKRSETTTLVVRATLEAFDCPRSLAVWILYNNGEHRQLVDLDTRPEDYNTSYEFRNAYQATKLLSKADFLDLNIDRKEAAREKFLAAENHCKEYNRLLLNPAHFVTCGVESLISRVIRKISVTLGDFDAEAWVDACDFGPGSTFFLRGQNQSHARKYQEETGTTPRLITFLTTNGAWKHVSENWSPQLTPVETSRVITVPKNAKEERTIAVEPGINIWFQKGIGTLLKKRLLRKGLDLDERGKTRKRNQLLCEEASKTGTLATIDFSAASDTINRKLVEILLPPDWYHAMVLTRTSHGLVNKKTRIEFEKFSSMGNGFTFELESLIFWASAIAVCEHLRLSTNKVSVFGDDVIIPSDAVDLYLKLVKSMGFVVNQKKSYTTGYFRESCGDHWFNGLNCKPYYLRKVIQDERDIYKAANSIRRLAHRRNHFGCDRALRHSWRLLREQIPLKKRNLISEGYGDGGFISNFDEAMPTLKRARDYIEGFFCKSLVFHATRASCEHHGLLLSRVRKGSPDLPGGNQVILRSRGKWVRKRLLIPRWYDLGPWI